MKNVFNDKNTGRKVFINEKKNLQRELFIESGSEVMRCYVMALEKL
jgi:hypothetical protein